MNAVQQYSALVRLENNEDPFKNKYPEGWEHGCVVETKDKVLKLYAKDYNFKELFVYLLN